MTINAFELLQRSVVLLDFETTGLDRNLDRAIEVAAIRYDGEGRLEVGRIIRPYPLPQLSPKVSELTGITQEMVEEGMSSWDVFGLLRTWVTGAVIIGHNVPFDIGFLNTEFERHGFEPWRGDFIDTRAMATFTAYGKPGINRGGFPYTSYKLEDVCEVLGITLEGAHRAMNDVEATEQIFLKLFPICLQSHRPIFNAMVRPNWVQDKINRGQQKPEYVPARATVYPID